MIGRNQIPEASWAFYRQHIVKRGGTQRTPARTTRNALRSSSSYAMWSTSCLYMSRYDGGKTGV